MGRRSFCYMVGSAMTIEHIKLGNVSTAYEMRGSGPPLLLLHGGGGGDADLHYYDRFVELISPYVQTIAYDQRDAGASVPVTDEPYALIDVAKDAVNLIKALGFERVNVLGTSAGGLVAQLLAANWPEVVDRLIVNVSVDPNVRLDFNSPTMVRRAEFLRQGNDLGLAELFTTPAYVATHPEIVEMFHKVRLAAANPSPATRRRMAALTGDHPVDHSKIIHETLVVAGELDPLAPVDRCAQLAELIPNAEFKVVPQAGHAAVLQEPEFYVALVRSFLEV
jgi:pimeloyl-ACP methyl ester carboxylesterase